MSNRLLKSRRGAQAEPAPSAQFFRQLAETLPHMVWSARADGSADYFNARVFEYTGRTLPELADWGWRSMVHPEDWERCFAHWTNAFKRGQPYEVEYRLRRHDGEYQWYLGAAMPQREAGRIVRWFGSCTDIENQKRAEHQRERACLALESLLASRANALQEDGRRLRAFFDSMPTVAWIKDSKLCIVWASASFVRIFGKPLETMLGRDDYGIWPKEIADQIRSSDEKALRINGPVQNVINTPLADGSVGRWLGVRFPLADETGALGVAGIAFDTTEPDGEAGADGQDNSPLTRLSGRELQVLHLLLEGCTSAEIGARLSLSPKSVDTYRSRLMAKLGIEDLPTLVKFAIRHGLTTDR